MPPPSALPRLARRPFLGATLGAVLGCARSERPIAPSSPPSPPASGAPSTAPRAPDVRPLFEAFPALGRALPHTPLALLPTPVERAAELGAALGLRALHIKRDDLSGAVYGGGKTRKLELFLGDALRGGHKTVITFGAVGSNQAVATAAYAAQLGLGAILMLLPQPADERVRQSLLADLHFGATVRLSPGEPHAEAAARRIAAASGDPGEPYVIPTGGSSPLGNAGFVAAAFELKQDIDRGALPEPDVLYIAMGTMGSAVGLCLGMAALGLKTRVVAVRASSPGTSSEPRFRAMLASTRDYLRRLDPSFPAVDPGECHVTIAGGQLGAGYAMPTPKGTNAIRLARELAHLELEPTYTGKALAALVDDARALSDQVVLFWNTHNSRTIDVTGADARDLPAELRGYFAPRRLE
jgi:1-aminocyclopropane-1-carboxylate deaminase/D-cysteine desulfhydrase-like pyridoxal-dependent ACC family enzyme